MDQKASLIPGSGPFHNLFFAEAVKQNFVKQNCIWSLFCPLFHNLFFVDSEAAMQNGAPRDFTRGARTRATRTTRYLPGSLSLKRRADLQNAFRSTRSDI